MPVFGVWLAGALVLGVCVAPWCPAPGRAEGWLLAVTWVAAATVWFAGRQRAWVVLAALLINCGLAACILTQRALASAATPALRLALDERFGSFRLEDPTPPSVVDPVTSRVILLQDAARRDGFVALRARVTALHGATGWRAAAGGVALSVSGDVPDEVLAAWHGGVTLELPITFRRPARFLNDGVPDAEVARALAGVSVLGSVKSRRLVEVRDGGGWISRGAAQIRRRARQAVDRAVGTHDAVSGAVVTAVLIGDDSGLPDDLRDRWQVAGTYHVLAISGGNVAIIVVLAVAGGLATGRSPRGAAALALAVLMAFACVVTPGASVRRATLMAGLHLAARIADHRAPAWQALAVAVAAMTVADPLALQDVGFLLTCGATAALIAAARRVGLASTFAPMRWVVVSVAATAAVEAVVFPVGLWFFSRVSIAGVGLNLVAVPLMTVAQVTGIACVALDVVGASAQGIGWVAHVAVSILDWCTRATSGVPGLAWQAPRPSALALVVYYMALGIWWAGPRAARVAAGVLAAGTAVALAAGVPTLIAARHPQAGLRLTMFDVGQAESLLVEAGTKPLLVDTGGRPFGESTDIGRRVLVPALWTRGVTAIGALLVTHPDPDHAGGAVAVFDALAVEALWLGIDVPNHEPSARLQARAAAEGARVMRRRANEQLAWGSARVRVLHPPEPDWERRRVRNDDSVVLEVVRGDVALLLAGDVSAEVERSLIPMLTPARVRILKVAHHGSRTSTSEELLHAWRPDLALISCGRANSFGHPAPQTLSRLAAVGATILRTDLDGQITVWTDGRLVRAETYRGRRVWVRPRA